MVRGSMTCKPGWSPSSALASPPETVGISILPSHYPDLYTSSMSQSLDRESHCTTCSQKFPSPEDLNVHLRIYDVYSLLCHISHDADMVRDKYFSCKDNFRTLWCTWNILRRNHSTNLRMKADLICLLGIISTDAPSRIVLASQMVSSAEWTIYNVTISRVLHPPNNIDDETDIV